MKNLAIFGASGHGKVVADIAQITEWQSVTFYDDAWPETIQNGHWEVLGNTTSLLANTEEYEGIIVAIGNNEIRWKKQQQISKRDGQLATIIHPTAIVSQYAEIGSGTIIMPKAVINAYAIIGDACIINTGAIVEHDCNIGNAVHIAPGATLSGNVTIGDQSWFGVGATARQGTKIGSNVTVGAGAVVVSPIADGETVVGCPAKPLTPKLLEPVAPEIKPEEAKKAEKAEETEPQEPPVEEFKPPKINFQDPDLQDLDFHEEETPDPISEDLKPMEQSQ